MELGLRHDGSDVTDATAADVHATTSANETATAAATAAAMYSQMTVRKPQPPPLLFYLVNLSTVLYALFFWP